MSPMNGEVSAALPDFANPPVVEVALSVQFARLSELKTPHIGGLWSRFRNRYPRIEEHPPIEPTVERFGTALDAGRGINIEIVGAPPTPRCWFLNERGTELIQFQPDRFIHNWRKVGEGEEYPRYPKIRETFETEIKELIAFIGNEQLGQFRPEQCEVTYVNHILPCSVWSHHGDLHKVLTNIRRNEAARFLPAPEDVRARSAFVIPAVDDSPLGRLRCSAEPAFRRSDNKPLIVLTLIARGKPTGDGVAGVLGFMDIGREWIVRGFVDLTTPDMHAVWGLKK